MLALYFCPIFWAENNPARTQVVFPIVVNTEPVKHLDDFWRSEFQVFNSNPDPVTATFTVFDSNSVVQEMASVTINGFNFGHPVFRQPVVMGWVRVTASLPVLVRETIHHRVFVAGTPPPGTSFTTSTLDQAPPLLATRRQFIEIVLRPTTDTRRFTGLSIVFPSDVSNSIANGKLIHRWVDGRKVSEKNIQLRANGQLVGLLTELLPPESLTVSPYITGSLEITFDKGVFISVIEFFPASIYATANPVELADREHLSVPLSGTF
jgi:hypothetical protein